MTRKAHFCEGCNVTFEVGCDADPLYASTKFCPFCAVPLDLEDSYTLPDDGMDEDEDEYRGLGAY